MHIEKSEGCWVMYGTGLNGLLIIHIASAYMMYLLFLNFDTF